MNPSPRPTMADVARAAGVSPTTVSHVLNDKGRVDAATRAHVRQTAHALEYTPSRAARSLALGRPDTIGIFLPSIADLPSGELLASDWYGRIAVGASQAALQHGRALVLLSGATTGEELQQYGLEGAVILDPIGDDARCAVVQEASIPSVLLGKDNRNVSLPHVVPDTQQGMTALLDHLAAAGAERIGVVAMDLDWSAGKDALAAYHAWSARHGRGVHIASSRVTGCRSREEVSAAGAHAAASLLSGPQRPDALIGLFEDFGHSIISAAREVGLDVPGDLLVAQDIDGVKAQLSHPPITALDLHPSTQVAEAMRLLLDRDAQTETIITTSVTLRQRLSTACGGRV